MARMTFKRMWLALCLCAFPVLGFAGQDMDLQRHGPYDMQILNEFQKKIVGMRFNPNWCPSEPLVSRVFFEGSCNSFEASGSNIEKRWYYIMSGKPAAGVSVSGHLESRAKSGSTKSRLGGGAVAPNLDHANTPDDEKIHGNGISSYDDVIAFLIEIDETGKILDSTFYIFYDLKNFENRDIKPDFSNFVNVESYIRSVKKYSQGMGFEDIIKLIEEGGLEIYEIADSSAIFVTPINPYNPHSSILETRNSIEFRSGIIFNPNSPDYAQVRVSKNQLVFETSVKGSREIWETVE